MNLKTLLQHIAKKNDNEKVICEVILFIKPASINVSYSLSEGPKPQVSFCLAKTMLLSDFKICFKFFRGIFKIPATYAEHQSQSFKYYLIKRNIYKCIAISNILNEKIFNHLWLYFS